MRVIRLIINKPRIENQVNHFVMEDALYEIASMKLKQGDAWPHDNIELQAFTGKS
ncbi:hypothetical protein GCM10007941_33710 [Amphritea balenae]|nr:hypothetical protein GCM10007941_33710 [Amphritea balenae]